MNRRIYLWTLLITALSAILLRSTPVSASDGLTIYGNAVKFANPAYDSLVRVDFPFSVERQQFMFSPLNEKSNELFARIFADVVLYNPDGMPVDSTSRLFLARAESYEKADLPGVRVFNFLTMYLKPGLYTARITVIDADSKSKGEFFIERLKVMPPERRTVRLSEIMLAYDVHYVGSDSVSQTLPQVKNGFYITPNPSRVFAATDSTVFIYAEAYNLDNGPEDDEWTVSYAAFDADGQEFLGLGSRTLKTPGESIVISDRFDIKGWPTGLYSLHATIKNSTGRHSSSVEVPFRIISKDEVAAVAASFKKAEDQGMPGDPYNRLTTREKEQLVGYLLTPAQKQTLTNLSDVGKENFMAQYWREHDIDPTTPEIENRLEMINRFNYANDRYSTNEADTDGWNQPRGRIYMLYGAPDEINDFQAPIAGEPFQIWYYYHIQEGKYFVFVDQFENGAYMLVHSNVYGEPYDKKWESMIDEGRIDEMDREN